ncbi:hypothetical protein GALMADRAFT_1345906 [Galerina marginata CBS 339.88]|uniref:Uncharacterized protein n=1 Tax=Galerina marginata (strain CBS 339.88) TaxID=685588 RepID=A0A067STJ8_GALM3|nr:hypothetical protein GALMADRAFT_1345906 [Galerina marginata CBS 339.88]
MPPQVNLQGMHQPLGSPSDCTFVYRQPEHYSAPLLKGHLFHIVTLVHTTGWEMFSVCSKGFGSGFRIGQQARKTRPAGCDQDGSPVRELAAAAATLLLAGSLWPLRRTAAVPHTPSYDGVFLFTRRADRVLGKMHHQPCNRNQQRRMRLAKGQFVQPGSGRRAVCTLRGGNRGRTNAPALIRIGGTPSWWAAYQVFCSTSQPRLGWHFSRGTIRTTSRDTKACSSTRFVLKTGVVWAEGDGGGANINQAPLHTAHRLWDFKMSTFNIPQALCQLERNHGTSTSMLKAPPACPTLPRVSSTRTQVAVYFPAARKRVKHPQEETATKNSPRRRTRQGARSPPAPQAT